MIIARAPMRISFVGGGTDLPDFYRQTPGRVISTAIDKYVYIVLNRTPLVNKVSARYSISETVDHPKDLANTRIRAALLDMGIHGGIEIASFAPLPSKTGLGSSSSFSVALLKALYAYQGWQMDAHQVAEEAARLEIELVGEPIGKQDQYAAAFGGLNVIQFNQDESVHVDPLFLDYRKKLGLQDHLMLFFTGITRDASSVLSEQKKNITISPEKFKTMKEMADSVHEFRDRLSGGDFKGLGTMLHDTWMKKRSLASNLTNSVIDQYYEAGKQAGAWGGKILGAGGGGCVMFLVPPEHQQEVRQQVQRVAKKNNLKEFKEIPVKFVQSGAEIVFNGDVRPEQLHL